MAENDPQSFPKGGDLSEYTRGLETGNPMMDMLSALLMSKTYMPRPTGTQSTYDALMQQARSYNFIKMQSDGFANNQLAQRLNGDPDSMLMRSLGFGFGSPNGLAMRMLSPLIGGNPVAAQQQMYAGFTGSTMGAFGRTTDMGYAESQRAMKALTDVFYNQTPFDQTKIDRSNARVQDAFSKQIASDPALQQRYERYGLKPGDNVSNFLSNYKPPGSMDDVTKVIGLARGELNEIWTSTDKTETQDVKDKTTDALKNRVIAMREELKKLNMGITDDVLNKYISSDMKQIDWKAIEQVAKNSDPAAVAQDRLAIIKKIALSGQTIDGPIDYTKTRGFNLEDFTSAGIAAADLQLVGKGNRGPEQLMRNLATNSGGMLSAARSVFGRDKSGGELVQEISRMLGSSAVDITSDSGARDVEKMLRDTKAAARVAGASIDSVVSIIKEAQALAQSKPELRYLSGQAITDITQKALITASAINSIATPDEIRRNGGVQGMVGSQVASDEAMLQTRSARTFAALALLVKGNKDATKDLQEEAPNWSENNNLSFLKKFTEKYGSTLGTTDALQLSTKINGSMLQNFALQDKDISNLSLDAGRNFNMNYTLDRIDSLSNGHFRKDLTAAFAKDPSLDPFLWMSENQNYSTYADYARQSDPNGKWLRYNLGPKAYRDKEDELKAQQDQWAATDTILSKSLDYAYAPVTQKMFQDVVMDGDFSKKGFGETTVSGLTNIDPTTGKPVYAKDWDEENFLKNKQERLDAFMSGISDPTIDKDKVPQNIRNLTAQFLSEEHGDLYSRFGKLSQKDQYSVLDSLGSWFGGSFEDAQTFAAKATTPTDKMAAELFNAADINKDKAASIKQFGLQSFIPILMQAQINQRVASVIDPFEKSVFSEESTAFGHIKDSSYKQALLKAYNKNGNLDAEAYEKAIRNSSVDDDILKTNGNTSISSYNKDDVDAIQIGLQDYHAKIQDLESQKSGIANNKDDGQTDILRQILKSIDKGSGGLADSITGFAKALLK